MFDDEDALAFYCGAPLYLPGLNEETWQTIILLFSNYIFPLKHHLIYTF